MVDYRAVFEFQPPLTALLIPKSGKIENNSKLLSTLYVGQPGNTFARVIMFNSQNNFHKTLVHRCPASWFFPVENTLQISKEQALVSSLLLK